MTLVLDWQKKLGYKRDPFKREVLKPVSHYIVGTTGLQERLNLFLIRGELYGTIAGEPGSGKTTFLSWTCEQLGKSKKLTPQYVDGKDVKTREQLVHSLMMGNLGFIGKRLAKKKSTSKQETILEKKLKKKQHIILVDNAGALKEDALELLEDLLKIQTIVILSDSEDKLPKFSAEDKLKLRMPSYSTDELSDLLRGRIEAAGGTGLFPFSDEEIQKLVQKAEHNPEKLLKLSRERAMELSLKVTEKPKSEAQPRKGFLSIRIAKESEAPHDESPDEIEIPIEAEELAKIVEERSGQKDQPPLDTDHEDLMKELEKHLKGQDQKPPKKSAKKKSSKKKKAAKKKKKKKK